MVGKRGCRTPSGSEFSAWLRLTRDVPRCCEDFRGKDGCGCEDRLTAVVAGGGGARLSRHANVAQSKQSVFPVPVGLSSKAFRP